MDRQQWSTFVRMLALTLITTHSSWTFFMIISPLHPQKRKDAFGFGGDINYLMGYLSFYSYKVKGDNYYWSQFLFLDISHFHFKFSVLLLLYFI